MSKGSYLNIGVHFLWQTSGHLSFDLGYRIDSFVTFESEAQFAHEADRLAAAAVVEVERLRALLAGVLITQQRCTLRLPEIAEPITDTDVAVGSGAAVH